MKNLILVLVLALSCSISFASARPEKDGPFPKLAAGLWASQNSSKRISVQVAPLASGKIVVLVMVTDSHGQPKANGTATMDPRATSATVALNFVNGRTEPMTVRLFMTEGKSGPVAHLQVVVHDETMVFSRLP
jgi:hypothetical protein